MKSPRGKPTEEAPWCWQSKAALRKIQEAFSERSDCCHAIAVYVILTQTASDRGTESFKVSQAEISKLAGISRRKCIGILEHFVSLKLVKIEANCIPGTGLKSESTYTLLSMCTVCTSMCTGSEHARSMHNSEEEREKNSGKKNGAIQKNGGEEKAPLVAAAKSLPLPFRSELHKDHDLVNEEIRKMTDADLPSYAKHRELDGKLKPKSRERLNALRQRKREIEAQLLPGVPEA